MNKYLNCIKIFVFSYLIFATTIQESIIAQGLSLKPAPKGWTAFLKDVYVLDCQDCKEARADVTYMFADIKFRDDAFKICEFGEGVNSGTAMSKVLVDGKVENLIKPYWNLMWVYLAHIGLPVWYVGLTPSPAKNNNSDSVNRYKTLAWDLFKKMGGHHVQNLRMLEKEILFSKLSRETRTINPSDLHSYKGIIVYSYNDNRSKAHHDALEAFKKKYKDFLVLDAASWEYGASKSILAKHLSGDLAQYKPKWGIYSKRYTSDLAKKIINDLESEIFVIKPLNSGRSNGVIFTTKNELDNDLKKILIKHARKTSSNNQNKEFGIMPYKTKLYSYWELDKNDSFMVEAYEQSKLMIIDGKTYDPSMRVFFAACHDNGKVYVWNTGAYWKIPHKALEDNATLTEKHKTVSVQQPGFSGILVNAEDREKVKKIGLEAFAKIYAKMIRVSKKKKI